MARSFEEFLAAREGIADMDQYVAVAQEPFEDGLRALVEIPSVSQHASRRDDVVRCAARASEYLGVLSSAVRLGTVSSFGGAPGVGLPVITLERFGNPKWQTVIIYNHLDVQPASREDGWDTDPFEFVARDDAQVGRRYFGRGTTDDKGPALTALLAVKFAIQLGIPLNFLVVWESEEEAGSPNFPAWIGQKLIRRHLREFASPSLLISDTIWPAASVPAVGGVGRPFAMDPEGPHLQAAVEALKAGFGCTEVVFDRSGGSIGAVTHFTDVLPDLPVVLLGLSLPEHNYHGAQEHFDWRQAAGGIRTFVNYFERVAKLEDR